MSVKGLLGPVLGPVAAGVGGLFASDDAESAVTLRLLQEGPTVYNKLRKQLARGRGGPRSTLSIAEDVLHDKSLVNYDHFNGYARKADGGMSGDVYKGGVQGLYDEILGSVDEPDKEVVAALDEWLEKRLGREYGVSMEENRAIDLQKRRAAAGAGAGATAAAGTAAANESPEMGWREWPTMEQPVPTSPAERGFKPWSDYEKEPVIDTGADMMLGNPMGAMGNMAPIEGGDWLNLLGMPMAGLHGIARGLFGLATGEDAATAGAEAAHMMGSENIPGTNLMTPGYDTEEGWNRWGQFTEDTFNNTGAVTPEIAKAAGFINKLPQYIIPF